MRPKTSCRLLMSERMHCLMTSCNNLNGAQRASFLNWRERIRASLLSFCYAHGPLKFCVTAYAFGFITSIPLNPLLSHLHQQCHQLLSFPSSSSSASSWPPLSPRPQSRPRPWPRPNPLRLCSPSRKMRPPINITPRSSSGLPPPP